MPETIAQRNLRIHRLFAASIEARLSDLLGRPLTRDEIDVVRSYMLCAGFMSIEATDNGLRTSASAGYASDCLSHMKDEVSRNSRKLVETIGRQLPPNSPKAEAYA